MAVKTLRESNGFIETADIHLSKGSRKVLLVGVCHVGSVPYFQRVQQILDQCEEIGWTVSHEGAFWTNTPADYATYGIDPEVASTLEPVAKKLHAALEEQFGIVCQANRIVPRQSWIFSDPLIRTAVSQFLSQEHITNVKKRAEEAAANPRQTAQFIIEALVQTALSRNWRKETSPLVLLEERDKKAATAILEIANTKDVVACWGTRHLPGIVQILRTHSWRVTKTEWFPCLPTSI